MTLILDVHGRQSAQYLGFWEAQKGVKKDARPPGLAEKNGLNFFYARLTTAALRRHAVDLRVCLVQMDAP